MDFLRFGRHVATVEPDNRVPRGSYRAMARRPQPLLLDAELLAAARDVAAWGATRAAAGEPGPSTGEILTLIALLHSMPRAGQVEHLLPAAQADLLADLSDAVLEATGEEWEAGDELLAAAGLLISARAAGARRRSR